MSDIIPGDLFPNLHSNIGVVIIQQPWSGSSRALLQLYSLHQ